MSYGANWRAALAWLDVRTTMVLVGAQGGCWVTRRFRSTTPSRRTAVPMSSRKSHAQSANSPQEVRIRPKDANVTQTTSSKRLRRSEGFFGEIQRLSVRAETPLPTSPGTTEVSRLPDQTRWDGKPAFWSAGSRIRQPSATGCCCTLQSVTRSKASLARHRTTADGCAARQRGSGLRLSAGASSERSR